MITHVSIEVLSEKEVEDITCQTYFLLQNGWSRIEVSHFNNEEFKMLEIRYLLSPLEDRRWIKKGNDQYVFLERSRGDWASDSVNVRYFSREEAFELEMNKKSEPNDLL